MKLWSSKTKLFCETSFKNDMLTKHLTSEFHRIKICLISDFKWMLQSLAPATKKLSLGMRTPVTATRNDPCIIKHKTPAPATRQASFRSLFKSTTPANVFATLANSCACHVLCNVPKYLRLPGKRQFETQKTSRAPRALVETYMWRERLK